jgi:hypothetical protein
VPDLTTIVLSLGSALIVAYASNRFQRHREELKSLQEKGTTIVSGLKTLSGLYIEKYNVAKTLEHTEQLTREGANDEKMKAIENHIYGATQIHFPSCKPQLEEWLRNLGRADTILRHLANGSYDGEYDELTKTRRDKSCDYISEVSRATVPFIEAITREVELARSRSLFAEVRKGFFARFRRNGGKGNERGR